MNPTQASLLPEAAHARRGDPITSHHAAASVRNLTKTQERVKACLLTPAHDEEIIRRYRRYFPGDSTTDQSIRSRRSELVSKGEIGFSGTHALTATGRSSRIWRLVK